MDTNLTTLLIIALISTISCGILELGPDFGEAEKLMEPHLVMFYAPWCGHCKALNPTWYELSDKLARHTVRVAKIDATVYRSAAERYNVKGFPAIRLIGSDRFLEYVGERTTEALADFAIKGSRPLEQTVGSLGKLNDLKKNEDVVFLTKDLDEEFTGCLKELAKTMIHETIIAEITNPDVVKTDSTKGKAINERTELRPSLSLSKESGVLVLKDGMVYEYAGGMDGCVELSSWILSERFAAFQVGSYPVIHPLLFLSYRIVFYYGVEPGRIAELQYLSTQRESHPADFYFIHIDKAEYIDNLISSFTQMGSVIVYDPRSELYTYSIDPIKSIKEVLADTASGEAPLYGGTGFIPGSQKVWYRLTSNVWPIFVDYPFIMGLVIVMPIGLILMCCCNETKSKDDPIRQVRSSQSHMDLLWKQDIQVKEEEEEEDEEEKDEEDDEDEGETANGIEPAPEKDHLLKKDE